MNSQYLRFSAVALGSAAVAFGLFALGSLLAWRIFPYPAGADDLQRQVVSGWHLLGEKSAQFFILAALGFVAATLHHPTWRAGIVTALLAGLLFQAIAIFVYVVRFGFHAYRTYHAFWDTLLSTLAFAGLFGFFAVYQQYRRDKYGPAVRSSEQPSAGPACTPFTLDVRRPSATRRMKACLDVHYRQTSACAAAVTFRHWSDAHAVDERIVQVRTVQPYEPGQFFRRELPCFVAVLRTLPPVETKSSLTVTCGWTVCSSLASALICTMRSAGRLRS
jgi:hypothetical protein